jgi:hypothetical protein
LQTLTVQLSFLVSTFTWFRRRHFYDADRMIFLLQTTYHNSCKHTHTYNWVYKMSFFFFFVQ